VLHIDRTSIRYANLIANLIAILLSFLFTGLTGLVRIILISKPQR
jgi:hypothetical protein